jgi:hypothetical protein
MINPVQGTSPCADTTRNTLLCVRFSVLTDRHALINIIFSPTEIKAIEEGLFDEKRYSLETSLE